MKSNLILSTVAITALALATARAQSPGAAQQVESVQQRRASEESVRQFKQGDSAPELFPGENSDVGPQSVLTLKPRRPWFEASADVQYFYTDNLFDSERNGIESGVVVSTVELALTPTPFESPCGSYAPRVGYRHQWFSLGLPGGENLGQIATPGTLRTIRASDFDFNVSTVFSDLTWSHENWRAQIGFDFQQLLTTSDYDEFYREYIPRWGVQRNFPVTDRSVVAVGYEGDYRFTEANTPAASHFNDRTDHALYANYTLALCPHAVLQPFYRFKYTCFPDYFGRGRNDTLHSFGAGLYWLVCPNFNVRLFAGYELRRSDQSLVGYNRLDLGGGVNFNIRF